MDNRWIKFALMVVGWGCLGFLLSIEVYFNTRAGMKMLPIDFVGLAIPQFGRAVMWAALAPFILQLRKKMPLSRGVYLGGVSFHLAMSFLVMATFYVGRVAGYGVFFIGFEGFWWRVIHDFYGRNIIDMGFYWAVLGFGYSWELYQRYKSEELKSEDLENRLIETELKALREQLHPHFLFNTLNTISVLVREGRNDDAVTLIARLSSLLRMTLDRARMPEVTLREELDFLDRYIEIQKARFSDRLTVNVMVEPAALEARIPNLLLQPLVENAILHGIAPKTSPGRVDIRGAVRGDRLHLEVCDDGAGLKHHGAPAREGIGLSNTRARIARIYGSSGQMSLRSREGQGVSVQIVIPCRT